MICETCGAWTTVLETRKADDGFTVVRTRRCANEHDMKTYEVLGPIYRKSPGAVARAVKAARLRADLWARDARLAKLAATARSQREAAKAAGVSRQAIGKAVKRIRSEPRRRPGKPGRVRRP